MSDSLSNHQTANEMKESKTLFDLCRYSLEEAAKAYVRENPTVNPDAFRDPFGLAALHKAAQNFSVGCVELLLDHKANINLQAARSPLPGQDLNCYGRLASNLETALMLACSFRHGSNRYRPRQEDTAFLLIKRGADVRLKDRSGYNALWYSMRRRNAQSDSITFALLCCGADEVELADENRRWRVGVTHDAVETCTDEYRRIHALIEDNHRVLKKTLSTLVEVDTRVGLGDNGIYQEPLERVLEYCGLSMNKDQTVNTAIDGDEKRVLIPGQPCSAKYWRDRYILFKLRKSTRAKVYGKSR